MAKKAAKVDDRRVVVTIEVPRRERFPDTLIEAIHRYAPGDSTVEVRMSDGELVLRKARRKGNNWVED